MAFAAFLNGVVLAAAAPLFELPAPTGPYAIGTTAWRLTDESRQETAVEAGGFRQVEVLAWYPAVVGRGELAPYLREGLGEVQDLAKALGSATAFDGLASVRTHAEVDAAPAAAVKKFPVLVFSHGYTGMASAYTALLEELASHGYVVLSVIHPYEAAAATLADGRVVTLLDESGSPRPMVREVFGEWESEDALMAEVTSQKDDTERLRLLRKYLSGLRHTHAALRRWWRIRSSSWTGSPSCHRRRRPAASPAGSTSAAWECSAIPWAASRRASSASKTGAARQG